MIKMCIKTETTRFNWACRFHGDEDAGASADAEAGGESAPAERVKTPSVICSDVNADQVVLGCPHCGSVFSQPFFSHHGLLLISARDVARQTPPLRSALS